MNSKFTLTLLILCITLLVNAQTADNIIQKYRQATNENKIDTYDNMVRRITSTYSGVKVYMYEIFSKQYGYKCYTYTKVPLAKEQCNVEMFVNGMGFSFSSEWQRSSNMVDKSLKRRAGQAKFGPQNYENQIVRFLGLEDGFQVVGFVEGKNSTKMYFNPSSGYIEKTVSNVFYTDPNTNTEKQSGMTMLISAYKMIDGFYQPSLLQIEGKSGTTVYDGYWFNVNFPEGFFEPTDNANSVSVQIEQSVLLGMLNSGKVAAINTTKVVAEKKVEKNVEKQRAEQLPTKTQAYPTKQEPVVEKEPRNIHGYFTLGGAMRLMSSYKADPIGEDFSPYFDHFASTKFTGGALYYKNAAKKNGLTIGASLNIEFLKNQISVDFTKEEQLSFDGVDYYEHTYCYTKGNMLKIGANIVAGYTFPRKKSIETMLYVSFTPLIARLKTEPYNDFDKVSDTENSFYYYEDDTYVNATKLYVEPALGAMVLFKWLYINPSISFGMPTYNLEILTNDFVFRDNVITGDNTEYTHKLKYSYASLNVMVGMRF